MIDKQSMKEAVVDTAIAMPTVFILSTVLLYLLIDVAGYSTIIANILTTLMLTVYAVIRKYTIRVHFKNKQLTN